MSANLDEFLRWLAARGVEADRLGVYRDCAQRILDEARGGPVEAQHIEAARRALEQSGARPQTLVHVRTVGDALRRFQRGPAAQRQGGPPAASAERPAQPPLAWAAVAAAVIACVGAGGYLWIGPPRGIAKELAPSSVPAARAAKGDPSEQDAVRRAYVEFERAMLAGDLAKLRTLAAEEKLAELSAADAEQKLELARALYPRGAKIEGVKVQGATALLTARAAVGGQTARGRIAFVQHDGGWKLRSADWQVTFGADATAAAPKPRRDLPRPADFPQLVGTWSGKETAGDTEWTIAFAAGHRVDARSSRGESYAGEVMIRWDLGILDGSLPVPPGWAPLDVEIDEASWPEARGQIALAAFSLTQGELRLCGGAPGSRKRVRSFEQPGQGFRCMTLHRIEDVNAAPAAEASAAAAAPGEGTTAEGSAKDAAPPRDGAEAAPAAETADPAAPNALGQATLRLDGEAARYELRTGFGSDTDMARPEQGTLHFELPGPRNANLQRILLTLDATQVGRHYADGQAIFDQMFRERPVDVGERGEGGRMAVLRWIADGGQVYAPKPDSGCAIDVSSPYTGRPDSELVVAIEECVVHSAGIDHTLSGVVMRVNGALER